ncbi:MAG: hypothetical protein OM95_03560 [Bdellovibrio sp. ArHS]|uniref:PulJ/GspJ family protein n=1 Tax=Bdellovibrio sp. ArHS TaxID=1569284 RepID=UPI000583B6CD|nr:hypothetical protein [Bdellovibrio sp. ArHS]KHD89453.1 MAG: hypothetical protein OM95_03560 [Bdellovibrio sp. ArHS]
MAMAKINNKGFTLVQTMLAVGISSMLVAGIATAVSSGIDSMSHSRSFYAAEDLAVQISGMLGDPTYCNLHFAGKQVPGSLPAVIENNVVFKDVSASGALGSKEIIKVGKPYQNILSVESIAFKVDSALGANRYLGSIDLGVKGKSGLSINMNRTVPLHLATDESGKIVSCSRLSEPTQGTAQGVYSPTCVDFAAKGWPSKAACFQDGRWHLIYENSESGGTVFGKFEEFEKAIGEGADVKVTGPGVTASDRNELCQQAYRSGITKTIYCLSPVRFAGEMNPFIGAASARFGTDGSIYCSPVNQPNTNGCPGIAVPTRWYVRY